MYRIFLIEDDETLALAIKTHIESWGNDCLIVSDFHKVTQEFKAADPHLVLLDINLPYFNGFHWCQEIRNVSNVPVVFISSASDNMNIVMAMNMGGDDFLPKPVDPMILTAKISAVLRRTYEFSDGINRLEFSGAVLNPSDNTITYNGTVIDLTKNESRILNTLLENKGKIVSRDTLMMKLWADDCFVEENTLTVNVGRLRKKLEENGLKNIIHTKPGSGYIIS